MSLTVTFPTLLPSQWSMNMVKALALRLNQCFGPFTMLPVEGSSRTGVFRDSSNHIFRGRQFRKYISYLVVCFWKCSKFNADWKNAEKKSEKMFCFWDQWIWIVWTELNLLRREYLTSAVYVLTKSLKTFHVTKSHFFKLNYVHINQSIW